MSKEGDLRSCLLEDLVQGRLLIGWLGNRPRVAHIITVKAKLAHDTVMKISFQSGLLRGSLNRCIIADRVSQQMGPLICVSILRISKECSVISCQNSKGRFTP